MSRFVAVEIDGTVGVRLPDALGNYETLCGLDGNDDSPGVGQSPASVPRGAKVDCPHCTAIWLTARKFKQSDFNQTALRDALP
jgi:hypothetical protein